MAQSYSLTNSFHNGIVGLLPGFPPTLENLEKSDNFFQSGEKSGNFEKIIKSQGILSESGKSQGKLGFMN